MMTNSQKTVDLIIFTKKVINGRINFFYAMLRVYEIYSFARRFLPRKLKKIDRILTQ